MTAQLLMTVIVTVTVRVTAMTDRGLSLCRALGWALHFDSV